MKPIYQPIDPRQRAVRLISAAAAVLLMFASCSRATTLAYDDDAENSGGGVVQHPSEVSVAYLRSLAVANSTTIRESICISGRVTATDAYGEYYKCIYIEDGTGGIEVEIDGTSLHRTFALYDRCRIECHGMALGRYGSTIELGLPPSGEYTVDRIPLSDIGRYMSVDSSPGHNFAPVQATIASLEPSLVGRTVKIADLHAVTEGLCWCETDPLTGDFADTERTVADRSGSQLAILVRGRCLYAAEMMPDGEFTLCGVLEYRSGRYALRITNHGIL